MGVFDRKSADGADTTAVPGDAHGEKGRLSGRLGSWIGRSGGLVASVADSVKEVSRGGLLRQALEARDRGNLGAAFHLAREEHDVRPDDDDGFGRRRPVLSGRFPSNHLCEPQNHALATPD